MIEKLGSMCETSLSVWFGGRLCRDSFGQVDAFIEHKKQKHFTQFQNTTSIVFQKWELGELCPLNIKVENQLVDEINEPTIKIEVNDDDPINPVSSEIIDDPISGQFELKNELITYESEASPHNEYIFLGLEQPEQNPYVLLKRLTSDEIRNACVAKHHYRYLKCEQKNAANNSGSRNSFAISSKITHHNEVDKSHEIQPTPTFRNISTEDDRRFECKLCSKQLESAAQLKIHVGICALNHEDRNRFCDMCNRKYCDKYILKEHRLRFHGTEEEKSSLYKFKCHLCPKQYKHGIKLRFHLKSHKKMEKQDETTKSKSLKCSEPYCGKEFKSNLGLRLHISTVHLGMRPFSCHFSNCNKTFSQKGDLNVHLRIHTGERPYKCTVYNCNEAFMTSQTRSFHHRRVHCSL